MNEIGPLYIFHNYYWNPIFKTRALRFYYQLKHFFEMPWHCSLSLEKSQEQHFFGVVAGEKIWKTYLPWEYNIKRSDFWWWTQSYTCKLFNHSSPGDSIVWKNLLNLLVSSLFQTWHSEGIIQGIILIKRRSHLYQIQKKFLQYKSAHQRFASSLGNIFQPKGTQSKVNSSRAKTSNSKSKLTVS
jgi:hypothetical protein